MRWLRQSSLMLALVVLPSLAMAKPLNDAIVAIVNNEVITLKDLKDYIGGVYRQLKVEHRTPKEIQEIMTTYEEKGVNQLVEDKIILAAANSKGIEIRPEVIAKRLKEIKDRYPSEDEFQAEINSQGITATDLKTKILNQMKSKYIVDIEVREKIFINPEDVTRYYNDHKDEFEDKTKYNLDSIYISFKNGKEAALAKIKEARTKAGYIADFKQLIKDYSESPSVGTLEQGQMVPAIEKEIFSLKKGEISQPLEVENGVYIFKVNEIIEGHKQSIDEVKDQIYEQLFQHQFQDKFRVWLDKLRSKAYVEIRN